MPRLMLLSQLLLLFCCSLCLGAGAAAEHWGASLTGAAAMTLPGNVLGSLSIAMVATAALMLLGEWFTGMRWTALLVLFAAAAAAWLTFVTIPGCAGHLGGPGPGLGHLFRIRLTLWALAWFGTACWFARLAAAARADR